MKVDHPLVDAHLEAVPRLGALTARGLPGGDLQGLGGHPDGSLDLEVLLLGALDQVGADLLQALDGAGGQGDPDAVNHLVLGGAAFAILVAGLKRNTGWLNHEHRTDFFISPLQIITLPEIQEVNLQKLK